ncbi:MAG: SufD family Fe-S cluster assembly protein [Treponema sp.]|nr:SufD family Fe-S cluster assembly protein [Treponema sp.]
MATALDVDVNQFPSLTWHHLAINHAHVSTRLSHEAPLEASRLPEGVSCTVHAAPSQGAVAIQTGLGSQFDKNFDAVCAALSVPCREFSVREGIRAPFVYCSVAPEPDSQTALDTLITAEEGSDSTFVFDFHAAKTAGGAFTSRIRVDARQNARVHIVTVNLLGLGTIHCSSLGTTVSDGASVQVTSVDMGGGEVYTGAFHDLSGYRACVNSRASYVVRGTQSLDTNYVARQRGRETESSIAVNGVVLGSAQKTWRGTIDFVKGCAGAKGDEQEDVLLSGDAVLNKTLPVILCDEEDVEGRHGSSIGKLGKDMLFYLQSRGIDRKNAMALMIHSKVNAVSRFIPDSALVERIESYLEGAF